MKYTRKNLDACFHLWKRLNPKSTFLYPSDHHTESTGVENNSTTLDYYTDLGKLIGFQEFSRGLPSNGSWWGRDGNRFNGGSKKSAHDHLSVDAATQNVFTTSSVDRSTRDLYHSTLSKTDGATHSTVIQEHQRTHPHKASSDASPYTVSYLHIKTYRFIQGYMGYTFGCRSLLISVVMAASMVTAETLVLTVLLVLIIGFTFLIQWRMYVISIILKGKISAEL